ncbi:probable RNA-directed DNA polymerase from transposon X-element [Trichonephila clavipes]|nr:probable RNA-directed DNA polymerase from transposon X-element [Trichonephila clavipes]
MAPQRTETSRQTETLNQTPPIQNRNVTPLISTAQAPNLNIPNANNSDVKALLSTTVQCLIQLLNAMNTAPAIANNFDKVNSTQADANQISNCVLFDDFNAPHTAWNCNTNSSRGVRLLDFVNLANLSIAYPDSPTRFGINSANTLDIAVIRNFYYPYTINSLHDLSSDHNPVLLNFTLKLNKDITNPRAVHTNWPLFSKQLNTKLSLLNCHPNSINSDSDIDQKISEFTEMVCAAHSHASRPKEALHKSYTPPHIHKLIKIIHNVLHNRTFRVRVNNSYSNTGSCLSGVPQGSVLSPYLYNIYTHDFPQHSTVSTFLFADDSAVLSQGNGGGVIDTPFQLTLFDDDIQWVSVVKYLGLHIDSRLTFKKHIDQLAEKFWGRIHLAISLIGRRSLLSLEYKVILYKQILRPVITYGSPVWGAAATNHMEKIQVIQNKIPRVMTNAPWYVRNDVIHNDLQMEPISNYITKLSRNVFKSIKPHDNPIIKAQTLFTYHHPKIKYAYSSTKWRNPLRLP